jgi:7-cyano-7-deazaguanine reductase
MDFKPLDKSLPFESPDTIDADVLDTFDYEYPGNDISVVTETEEFTSVCPYSGLPDFGIVRLEYVPDAKIIELRSLKYYLLSYRNVGIFYEHLANKMLEDLVACCAPKSMTLSLEASPRGGLRSTVIATYPNASCDCQD